ncbi:MAG: NTP transferase domain-containing protein [Anaerolineaceae bacterium]|nr:NTP transferase domain-containing protein [Anaerolineaceae bacterium]
MYENFYAVIMAGGSGTRLWPLSRKGQPKQSLAIDGENTLFQQAVQRLSGLFPQERILVVTVADQVAQLSAQVPTIPEENYIIEPLPRGTASVVGLAAMAIQSRDPQGSMAILTADHLMRNAEHLRQLLKAAYQVAQKDYLVTLGITPTFPATGYGYIEKGEALGTFEGVKAFRVQAFKEKPQLDVAEKLVVDGHHVWNSGMFIWQVATVMAEFERQMPDLYAKLKKIEGAWQNEQPKGMIEAVWPTIQPQTIDYGIMEHAEKVAVIPSIDLGWNDVGSWESLFDALDPDESGNIVLRGQPITFDTSGTLICGDHQDRLIVTVGVQDLIIIESGNAILVCDRKQAQRVRDVVNYLKQDGREDYL